MGEAGTKICSYIVGFIYIVSGIGLLICTIIIHLKTESNPLSVKITDEEIDQILANNSQNDQNYYTPYYESQNFRGKTNLRFLMDYDICSEYIQKIKDLKKESAEYRELNDVFHVDIVFLNSISYIFAFSLVAFHLVVVYMYLISILSSCCCDQLLCLARICFPCFSCFIYLFGLAYIFFFIVLIIQINDSNIKNFAEFSDCSNVNSYYLKDKYSNIINLGNDLKICLYFLIANMTASCCLGYSSNKAKDDGEYLLIKLDKY